MKKSKLVLSRETLRNLDLMRAVGGEDTPSVIVSSVTTSIASTSALCGTQDTQTQQQN